MSDFPTPALPDAPITSFSVEYRLDATVTVNGENWVKPGASTKTTWRGIPSSEDLQLAAEFMMTQILQPTLSEVLEMVSEQAARLQGRAKS